MVEEFIFILFLIVYGSVKLFIVSGTHEVFLKFLVHVTHVLCWLIRILYVYFRFASSLVFQMVITGNGYVEPKKGGILELK